MALNKTGVTTLIAHGLVAALGSAGHVAMLMVVFMVAGLIACSTSFVTPVSTTWNLLVMEPGGFGDYVKVGLPLFILTMLITVGLVMVIYPV